MQFNDIITVYPNPTHDKFNKKVWGEGEEYSCRFVEKSVRTLTPNGEHMLGDGVVHFDIPFPDLSIGDRITYEGQDFVVTELKKPKDSIGRVRFFHAIVKLRAI